MLDRALSEVEVVDGDIRLAPGQLDGFVAALAGGLRAMGVGRRDVVAWQLPNWHEAVLLYRACWRLGAVAGPLHHGAGEADVAAMLDVLQPKVVFGPPGLPVRGTDDRLQPLLASAPVTDTAARPADLAAVLFTSGSTGAPKAVLHTHRGLAYKGALMAKVHGLTPADAILMPAPLAHVSGLLNAVLVTGAAGMKTVLMDRWDPEQALTLVDREAVSFMIGPPTYFVGMMGAAGFSAERVASLRLVSSGGAGVSPAFVDAASDALRCRVKRTYGSTEAPTVTTSAAGDPPHRGRDTDGRPTGEVELRVTNTGELLLRGPELFAGYADPEQTRAALQRGWFRSGDLATVDDEGWLTITGRIKDIIIRGGENISMAEVEAVLEAHPSVRQAVVVGSPDPVLGERVAAFVVAPPAFDLDACRAWFAERGVARYKTPERVVVVDAIPTLAAGKPDRAALKKRL